MFAENYDKLVGGYFLRRSNDSMSIYFAGDGEKGVPSMPITSLRVSVPTVVRSVVVLSTPSRRQGEARGFLVTGDGGRASWTSSSRSCVTLRSTGQVEESRP